VKTEAGYRVEIAVPGWNKSDIEISQHKDVLTVKGLCKLTEKEGESYVYKGLSGKEFVRTFTLHKHVQLKKAYMNRGLLCIDLDEVVPDEERPKMINIE
jgi:molecular chaperone IbpA